MPYKNGNPSQRRLFNESKKNALTGLVYALDDNALPEGSSSGKYSMYTGQIQECIQDRFLPLQRNALLTILREADVPHDSSNRFVPRTIYSYKDQLEDLLIKYLGLPVITLNTPAKGQETEADAETAIEEK